MQIVAGKHMHERHSNLRAKHILLDAMAFAALATRRSSPSAIPHAARGACKAAQQCTFVESGTFQLRERAPRSGAMALSRRTEGSLARMQLDSPTPPASSIRTLQ